MAGLKVSLMPPGWRGGEGDGVPSFELLLDQPPQLSWRTHKAGQECASHRRGRSLPAERLPPWGKVSRPRPV